MYLGLSQNRTTHCDCEPTAIIVLILVRSASGMHHCRRSFPTVLGGPHGLSAGVCFLCLRGASTQEDGASPAKCCWEAIHGPSSANVPLFSLLPGERVCALLFFLATPFVVDNAARDSPVSGPPEDDKVDAGRYRNVPKREVAKAEPTIPLRRTAIVQTSKGSCRLSRSRSPLPL
jgi:hypothetical protein